MKIAIQKAIFKAGMVVFLAETQTAIMLNTIKR